METLNAAQTATVIAPIISSVGSRYMLDPDTNAAGAAAGYPNSFSFYVAGRGGVLGDVDADVVYAAFMFFEKQLVEKLWKQGVAVEGARAAGKRYMTACDDWGRKHLGGLADLEKFIVPAEKLVASIDASGLSLFAGLRAEPLPTDLPARAYRLITLIRELRGGYHIAASITHGLTGLEATITRSREGTAKMHGWEPPYADMSGLTAQRDAVEQATGDAMARAISSALTSQEMNELAEQTQRLEAALATK